MVLYWKTQVGTAGVVLVKETGESMENYKIHWPSLTPWTPRLMPSPVIPLSLRVESNRRNRHT
jgi:hypothetical protein